MYQTIDFYDFQHAFENMDRSDNFSSAGLRALFNHIEELEADTGEQIELDVIALCCEFTEYSSIMEAAKCCGYDGDMDDESAMLGYIEEEHLFIKLDNGGIIIQE